MDSEDPIEFFEDQEARRKIRKQQRELHEIILENKDVSFNSDMKFYILGVE